VAKPYTGDDLADGGRLAVAMVAVPGVPVGV
jgi:hypothetical protein